MPDPNIMLESAVAEIETHLHRLGWDGPPALFALVDAAQLAVQDPQLAARLGIAVQSGALTPVEQEQLPDRPLDEVLAGISWPDSVAGCALSQEIVVLPPSAEQDLALDQSSERDGGASHDPAGHPVLRAIAHPQRREARLVAGVLRDGSSAVLLRLRAAVETTVDTAADSAVDSSIDTAVEAPTAARTDASATDSDLLTGPDLAPNLVAALLTTFD